MTTARAQLPHAILHGDDMRRAPDKAGEDQVRRGHLVGPEKVRVEQVTSLLWPTSSRQKFHDDPSSFPCSTVVSLYRLGAQMMIRG